jgi:hypothetical protein
MHVGWSDHLKRLAQAKVALRGFKEVLAAACAHMSWGTLPGAQMFVFVVD